MFERFTATAREAVVEARAPARQLLARLGVGTDRLRADLAESLRRSA